MRPVAVLLSLFVWMFGAEPSWARGLSPAAGTVAGALERAAGGPVKLRISRTTGAPSFLSVGAGHSINLDIAASARAEDRARRFLQSYGQALGLPGASEVTVLGVNGPDVAGMEHVRLQHTYRGVPVRGGQLTVHLRGAGVTAVHARTVTDIAGIDVTPTVSAADAVAAARALVAEQYAATDAAPGAPQLELFPTSSSPTTSWPMNGPTG
jgi:hypothetical protein